MEKHYVSHQVIHNTPPEKKMNRTIEKGEFKKKYYYIDFTLNIIA